MTSVLKVFDYRGSRIYIRSLQNRWYEVLVVFRGQIYCHQLQSLKPIKRERRASLDERDKGAIVELMDCGRTMVDNFKQELSFGKVVKKKVESFINQIKSYGKNQSVGEAAEV